VLLSADRTDTVSYANGEISCSGAVWGGAGEAAVKADDRNAAGHP
jgi:hypothetical protein